MALTSKAMKGARQCTGQEVKGMGPRTQEAMPKGTKQFKRGTPNKNVKMIKGR